MPNKIREMRERRGLSQADLAALLHTTGASVSRYEREDSRVTLPLLAALAKALRCSLCDLIGETVDPTLLTIPVRGSDRSLHIDISEVAGAQVTSLEAIEIGDRAMEPTLHPGDLCVVDTSERHLLQGLFAFGAAGTDVVRRVTLNVISGGLSLRCDHPEYPEEPINDGLQPLGRVVLVIKRL